MTIHTSVYTKTPRQISRLAELYEKRQVSDLTAQTLNKLVDMEISQTEMQLKEIERDLAEYEKQYGMSSHEFYEKYESGQTDDRMDFVEWASLTQMADDLRQHLKLLASEGQNEWTQSSTLNRSTQPVQRPAPHPRWQDGRSDAGETDQYFCGAR